MTTNFKKKPVTVQAVQWDGTTEGAGDVTGWLHDNGGHYEIRLLGPELYIETLEGWLPVSSGDWIIKGIKGEFYPCKPDVFALTYEAVDE